jgi:allantoate deiminase
MADVNPAAIGARAERMINTLGSVSAEPNRLVRTFLSPAHREAANLVTKWMQDAGLTVSDDALGTVRGSLAGNGAKRLLIGSHIDTVVEAGMFDGPFGVIAGILAAEHFAKSGRKLPFGIDVLAFGDEEGVRYSATLASSSACAGDFDFSTLELVDSEGVTLAEAITRYGKNPADIPAAAYAPGSAAAYVEVHIEQGPVLEYRKQPLGVVNSIAGQTYLNVEFLGEAGHAGTVPMRLRRDALAGAAECALAVERIGRSDPELVATVGRIEALPGAINVIPGEVAFTVDVRAPRDELREGAVQSILAAFEKIRGDRKLGMQVENLQSQGVAACAPWLMAQIEKAVAAEGVRVLRLPSGAGHDGQAMQAIAGIGMLFVRCKAGISHNPAEAITEADAACGARVLERFIRGFAPAC